MYCQAGVVLGDSNFEVWSLFKILLIRHLFAYNGSMSPTPTSAIHPFVIECKGCRKSIPAPVQTLPDDWIIANCPLCGEKRRYLPAEIFCGRLSPELAAKPGRGADPR